MGRFLAKSVRETLAQNIRDGNVIAFVGSGLSKDIKTGRFPSWERLLLDLNSEVAKKSRTKRKEIGLLIRDKEYLVAAQAIRNLLGTEVFNQSFKKAFEIKGRHKLTSEAHKILVSLPFRAIITTNYDQLIEFFYRKYKGSLPQVYTQQDATSLGLFARMPNTRSTNILFKPHGDLDRPETWVISSTDYQNALKRQPAYRSLMQILLSQYSFMFIGFSLRDPDFQVILDDVADAFEGETPEHYLLLRNEKSQRINRTRSETFYRNYRIRTIPIQGKTSELLKKISETTNASELTPESSLTNTKHFLEMNSNFESAEHRARVIDDTNFLLISKSVSDALQAKISPSTFSTCIQMQRIFTHHAYLGHQKAERAKLANLLIEKAAHLILAGGKKRFLSNLNNHDLVWDFYLIAIEDLGFPLVAAAQKSSRASKRNITEINRILRQMHYDFGIKPSTISKSYKELRAACFLNRILGLKAKNLEANETGGQGLLVRSLGLAKAGHWESVEAAILQDLVIPDRNPITISRRVKKLRADKKGTGSFRDQLIESIEIARHQGMHRRVISGLIGLSRFESGEARLRRLKHAIAYYEVLKVKQEPLRLTALAEYSLALDEIDPSAGKLEKDYLKSKTDELSPYYVKRLGLDR